MKIARSKSRFYEKVLAGSLGYSMSSIVNVDSLDIGIELRFC